jgi:nitrite reductase/ring-hydroxylating ferredoxin subunit
MQCPEEGCDAQAVVELHIPWQENMVVCPAHARTWAQKDGVVAAPIEGQEDRWP